MIFLYDVTERRLEAEALRKTRDLLQREQILFEATLENIEDSVVLRDATRRSVLANRSLCEMFGLSPRDLDGMSQQQFLEHVATLAEDPRATVARLLENRDALARADERLYTAKSAGRNRVSW
jgi:PAS domain S-box-containing protein